jgi:ferredoxin
LAPELFESDDEGYGHVIAAEVTPQQSPQAESAIRNCPEDAITWA